jgi:hypothetical protein
LNFFRQTAEILETLTRPFKENYMTEQERADGQDTMVVAAGLALMMLGAGMILSHPRIRKSALATLMPLLPELQNSLSAGDLAASLLPEVDRYMRLRSM